MTQPGNLNKPKKISIMMITTKLSETKMNGGRSPFQLFNDFFSFLHGFSYLPSSSDIFTAISLVLTQQKSYVGVHRPTAADHLFSFSFSTLFFSLSLSWRVYTTMYTVLLWPIWLVCVSTFFPVSAKPFKKSLEGMHGTHRVRFLLFSYVYFLEAH